MSDGITLTHDDLTVSSSGTDPDCIEVSLKGVEVYCASVVDDPYSETVELFKAFRKVYEAGMMAA